jgi:hypothetical protein
MIKIPFGDESHQKYDIIIVRRELLLRARQMKLSYIRVTAKISTE